METDASQKISEEIAWPRGRVTFLFTDIKDSTVWAQVHGDTKYEKDLRGPHFDRLRTVVRAHRGRFFQDKGDGVVAVFEFASHAVACAVALQRSFHAEPVSASESGEPLLVRMGLNTARAEQNMQSGGELRPVYGANALNFCSRVEGPADAGQILLSEETYSALEPEFAEHHTVTFHRWPGRKLKGYSEGHTLYDLLYDGREPKEPGIPWIPPWYRSVQSSFVARPEWTDKILDWDKRAQGTFFVLEGMGGLGKTRLALETGLSLRERYKHDVEFVRLDEAALLRPISVAAFAGEIARQLNLVERDPATANDPENLLAAWLDSRQTFLVLDNWESVDDKECAAWLETTLQGSQTRCLVTTRRAWPGTLGFATHHLDALEISETPADAASCPAGRLFIERVADDSFHVSASELPYFWELLKLTCGLPLAIELLAARAADRFGEFALFAEEVRSQRVEQLTLPENRTRTDRERYQSIVKCVAWSINFLPEEQRNVLPRLSVFPHDFARQTAIDVCAVPSGWLDEWRKSSLVERAGGGRFALHALIKDVLAQQLLEEDRKTYEAHLMQRGLRWIQENSDPNGAGNLAIMDAEWPTIAALHQQAIDRNNAEIAHCLTLTYFYIETRTFSALYLAQVQKTIAITSESDEEAYATLQNMLGLAYRNLPFGDINVNLAQSISCYKAALRVHTEEKFPMQWATLQNNLGIAYRNLPSGDNNENLIQAIFYYEAALRVYTELNDPMKWATTQNNLGIAYESLLSGDHALNLEKSISYHKAALRVYTETDYRINWATVQNSLGVAYSKLSSGDSDANLAQSISCYKSALRVRTETDYPMQWGMTQRNLGDVYQLLSSGDHDANLRSSIVCYKAALRVHTEETFPMEWAKTQLSWAIAECALSELESGLARLCLAREKMKNIGHQFDVAQCDSVIVWAKAKMLEKNSKTLLEKFKHFPNIGKYILKKFRSTREQS